jgi:ankyrin repeat protein
MRAVQRNDALAVKILINGGANLQERTPDGWSAVHYAILTDAAAMIRLFQEEGADIDAKCEGGKTPLHYACETGAAQCARTLIELGADINIVDTAGRSPLCLAVGESQDELVHLLLRCGAEPDESIHTKDWRKYEAEYERVRRSQAVSGVDRHGSVSTASTRHTPKFSSFPALSRRFSSHKGSHRA